ncbi:hypothetical protein HED60_03520 [Planctomycetales bacterium ZRK34]|nr:hypothetical protein HED60_03520 [Planctomycetales bacterium ZRK34]
MNDKPPSGGVQFPNLYTWFVFLSALDVMFTWIVLHFGGAEVNHVANWLLRQWGLWGMIALKFSVVVVILILCEYMARRDRATARRIAIWGVVLNALPVITAVVLLKLARG